LSQKTKSGALELVKESTTDVPQRFLQSGQVTERWNISQGSKLNPVARVGN
jgi:hypothetical protein